MASVTGGGRAGGLPPAAGVHMIGDRAGASGEAVMRGVKHPVPTRRIKVSTLPVWIIDLWLLLTEKSVNENKPSQTGKVL